MEAIVLAGGFGTRLRPVVPDLPKPLAPIAKRPFLEILLASLAGKGFHRIVLSVGYMAEKICSHFGDHFEGMELIYEIEHTPLGTGGAVRLAMSRCNTDHVFVFNGDTFLDLEVQDVETLWKQNRSPIIVACNVENTERYGRLTADRGRVLGFTGKGAVGPGLINAGSYVLPIDILDDFSVGEPFSLEDDFLTKAVTSHRFDIFVTKGQFIDIGVPEDYERAQIELVKLFQ